MELSVVSRTDVGRVRTNNEDNFLVDEASGVYVVCDGMGGHNAGEVASKICCEVIGQELAEAAKTREKQLAANKPVDMQQMRRAVETAITNACKEIFRQASKSSEHSGMGTTCTAMFIAGQGKAILGHVGDSRLYVLRGGNAHQLSEDHTYVNELVKRGALTKEQAKNHPQGNVLSRAMGVQATVSVDTMIFDVDPGDTYMLCSDGVYNYYPDSRDLATIIAGADMQAGIKLLIDRALERGGHDNCTAIMLRFGGVPAPAVAAEQRIAILKRLPIFAHLTYHELVRVLGLTQLSRARAGTNIIQEGQPGSEFYVVLSGEVEVLKGGNVITVLPAGVHLGEMAMIDNAPRSATVRARTDAGLLVMRRDEFFTLIRSEPVIASKLLWSFVKVLSGRLRETNEALQGARQEKGQEADLEIFLDEET